MSTFDSSVSVMSGRVVLTKENTYRDDVLIANWNEEWSDVKHMRQHKPVLSQVRHAPSQTNGGLSIPYNNFKCWPITIIISVLSLGLALYG